MMFAAIALFFVWSAYGASPQQDVERALLVDVYQHEDWASAVLQARRMALIEPDSGAPRLVLAAAYARQGRSAEAAGIGRGLLDREDLRPYALLLYAWVADEEGDLPLTRAWLHRHAELGDAPGGEWREKMVLRQAILRGDHRAARTALDALGARPSRELSSALSRPPRRRSPAIGALLSTVLPGAGQLWAGQPVEALSAVLLNGALVAGTWSAARNGSTEAAIALGFVSVGFYAGNVYGGADAALRFNRHHQERLLSLASRDGLDPGLPPLPPWPDPDLAPTEGP